MVRFWSIPGSRHLIKTAQDRQHLIKTSRDRRQDTQAEHLPEATSPSKDSTAPRTPILRVPLNCPRDHSIRGYQHPEVDSSRSEQDSYRTSLISNFNSASRTPMIYGVNYAARSSHILNVATTPTPTQTVTEDGSNLSHNQGHNPSNYEENFNVQIMLL